MVNNPDWIVEVLFDTDKADPAQMGTLCAQALVNLRRNQIKDTKLPHTLILAERFLQSIGWDTAIASKSPDSLFKVEFKDN